MHNKQTGDTKETAREACKKQEEKDKNMLEEIWKMLKEITDREAEI